jgi:hypothetical protein
MEPVMVVEVLDGHGRVRARHRIVAGAPELGGTVGRSPACDVVLDDPFVAAVHARIEVDGEGQAAVTDLGSMNGILIGGRRLHGVERARLPDGVFGVGRTRLRVRTAREFVAPEQVDRGERWSEARAADRKMLAAGFAVSIATTVFDVWTETAQPRELSTALVTMLVGLLAVTGLWTALWALASRVAFGESRWVRHATIVFVGYALLAVVALLVDLVNGALGLHLSSFFVGPLLVAVAASAALAGHLLNASPMRARMAVALGVTIPAVVIAATLWVQARSQARSPSHIADDDRILPPALVVRRGLPFDGFTATLAGLPARADARRAFVEREDPTPADDESE